MFELSDQDQMRVAKNVTALYQLTMSTGSNVSYNRSGSDWEWFFDATGKPFMINQLYMKIKGDAAFAGEDLHGKTAADIRSRTEEIAAVVQDRQRVNDEQQAAAKIVQLRARRDQILQALPAAEHEDNETTQYYETIFSQGANIHVRVKGLTVRDKKGGRVGISGTLEVENNTGRELTKVSIGVNWQSGGKSKKKTGWSVREGRGISTPTLANGAVAMLPLKPELIAKVEDVQSAIDDPSSLGVSPWLVSYTTTDGKQFKLYRERKKRDSSLSQLKAPKLRRNLEAIEAELSGLVK